MRRNAPVLDDFHGDPYTGDGRITLGSPEEVSLRRSASLAKDVLEFAGNQVEVGVPQRNHASTAEGFRWG